MLLLKLWLLILIFLVLYFSLQLEKMDKIKFFTPAPKASIHEKVLIVARWKSGSTYFGEILAQYPSTYYTYEPLHVLHNKV